MKDSAWHSLVMGLSDKVPLGLTCSLIRNANTFIKKKKEGLRELVGRFYDYQVNRETAAAKKAIFSSSLPNCASVKQRGWPPPGHQMIWGAAGIWRACGCKIEVSVYTYMPVSMQFMWAWAWSGLWLGLRLRHGGVLSLGRTSGGCSQQPQQALAHNYPQTLGFGCSDTFLPPALHWEPRFGLKATSPLCPHRWDPHWWVEWINGAHRDSFTSTTQSNAPSHLAFQAPL